VLIVSALACRRQVVRKAVQPFACGIHLFDARLRDGRESVCLFAQVGGHAPGLLLYYRDTRPQRLRRLGHLRRGRLGHLMGLLPRVLGHLCHLAGHRRSHPVQRGTRLVHLAGHFLHQTVRMPHCIFRHRGQLVRRAGDRRLESRAHIGGTLLHIVAHRAASGQRIIGGLPLQDKHLAHLGQLGVGVGEGCFQPCNLALKRRQHVTQTLAARGHSRPGQQDGRRH
jgi:hypothetical protein